MDTLTSMYCLLGARLDERLSEESSEELLEEDSEVLSDFVPEEESEELLDEESDEVSSFISEELFGEDSEELDLAPPPEQEARARPRSAQAIIFDCFAIVLPFSRLGVRKNCINIGSSGFLSRSERNSCSCLLKEDVDLILLPMHPYLKKVLIGFISMFLAGCALFCLIFFLRQPYTIRSASDAFFISSASCFALTGMAFVIRSGTFDVLNYGMYRLVESFRLDRKKRWDNAGDYKIDRAKKRQLSKAIYWPRLAASGFFLLMAILFLALYYGLNAN